jgi:hypothetical protein
MIATKALFESRKEEIEFYYNAICEIADNKLGIVKSDNHRFVRIQKSNFLVMLYNLIEACVKSGFEEVYEVVESESISYTQASDALRDIWSNYEISKAQQKNAIKTTYEKRVKIILEQVISDTPIILTKEAVETMASGNLDARKIKELLKEHGIDFTETSKGDKLRILTVKTKRNSLAHGEESFDEAARDLTLDDLEKIKDEVLLFIEDVINGIEKYYNDKSYVRV